MRFRSSHPTPTTLSLSVAAVLLLGLVGCKDTQSTPSTQPRTALVASAIPNTATGLEFVGEVRAKQRAELAFGLSGIVQQVLVDAGDSVRRDQLLATLEATPSEAQLNAAKAEIRRLQTVLDEVRRKQERLRSAYEHNAASDAEWTNIQAETSAAEAALAAAEAQRTGSAWNRVQSELRAPFDGVVASRQLEIGQAVGSGMSVISIDGSGRELWAVLPAAIHLAVGQPAKLAAAHGEITSHLIRLNSRVEAGGARRGVFSLPDTSWHVGETVVARLIPMEAAATGVLIPLRAVQGSTEGQATSVLRLDATNQTVERVAVTLGATQDGKVEILTGLNPGDRVVIAGGHSLAHGAAVKPVSELR